VWGIQLFVFGLFKKAIIADNFSRVVDAGFGSFDSMTSGDIICVMLCYTFQIYFDFSGYSDMATGICRMMNIELPMNFDSPYKSVSIRDFWKRWHLTLTRFLTKYVYFPLGGSRNGTVRTCINVMIVFALSGLWHGANWTFILWGLINGALSVLERLLEKYYNRLSTGLQWMYSFTTVNILWFLFRSDSITMWARGMGHLLKFENMNVSDFIIDAFYVKENDFIYTILGLGNVYQNVHGFTMITSILIALIICLGFENNYRRQWKSSVVTMIVTPFMLLWSLLSLSSEAVFIYFNF
ncbi:MAG: MBOAT family protein, partial [Lachnospiraceae bacterium]|nr:MBOAT family protein [Lachnospiraceae bacterium]